jgi:hypothetical protein
MFDNKYLTNYIFLDFIDKNVNQNIKNKLTIINKSLVISFYIHLRYLKNEYSFRLIDSFNLLELLTNSRAFIKKSFFFYNKLIKTNYHEIIIYVLNKRLYKNINFIQYFNNYFKTYYFKFIQNNINQQFNLNKKIYIFVLYKLNKLYIQNKKFTKFDKLYCKISSMINNIDINLFVSYFF